MQRRLQAMGTCGGFNCVPMDRVFSLQWESSFPFCQWVTAVYSSGLHLGEAVRFETEISVVEALDPGMQRNKAAHFVLGNVLGALQAQCQVHCHLGVPPPYIHPINHLQELPWAWGRDSVLLLCAACSANEGFVKFLIMASMPLLNYLHMAFTSETGTSACGASPQPRV